LPRALEDRPVVLLNCLPRRGALPAVVPDERAAGRAAAAALLERGHTDRIHLVGEVPPGAYAGGERLAGITAELATAGQQLAGHLACVWWPPDTRTAVHPLVAGSAGGGRPSAVIAINDRVAMGVYQAAAAAGVRIPEELSVVSFDGSDLARWLHPGLTSVALPYREMGMRAIELLVGEPPGARGLHRVPMPLQVRESIAAPES
jgi:LacI family transcriptional regulator